MNALTQASVVDEPLTSIYTHLARVIESACDGAIAADQVVLAFPPPHVPADFAFGCFPLAKPRRMSPAAVAEELSAALQPDEIIESAEPIGPYVNLRVRRAALAGRILERVRTSRFGPCRRQADETVMVEYVSPNTNKPLHLGHIRNAVLGRSVANLIEAQGARVIRCDVVNDRGIHIMKSMLAYQRWGRGETPESCSEKGDHFVGRQYVAFERALQEERAAWLDAQGAAAKASTPQAAKELDDRFNAESALLADAYDLLRRWEAEEPEIRELWRQMNAWVYAGFGETYATLGIHFDRHFYESEIYKHGREIVLDALERGLFERAPNGAVMAPLSRTTSLQDKAVLRADGTGLYVTQDIFLAITKAKEYPLTRSILCIGSEQNHYMKQLFAILKLLGFPWAESQQHLSYGMVYLPEGKMKSREGRVVDADQLVAEMQDLAAAALRERSTELHGEALRERALSIGLAAISFHFLATGKDNDIHFDPKSSLSFEGKTGPYLQYTHARVSSLLRKAGPIPELSADATAALGEESEWGLARSVMLFPAVVTEAAEALDPSRLAGYLNDLAQAVNRFYHDSPVLQAEASVRSARLALLQGVKSVLAEGLALLGIEALETM